GFADAHRHGGRRVVILIHDVEMVIEGRDLVDFRPRQLHLVRERREMRDAEAAVAILDAMEVLDEEVAAAGLIAQQPGNVPQCPGFDGAAAALSAAAATWREGDGGSHAVRLEALSRRISNSPLPPPALSPA